MSEDNKRKRSKRVPYTQMTLKRLRELGFVVDMAEKWLPFFGQANDPSLTRRGVRKDLYDFIDIMAMRKSTGIIGVQSTSAAQHTEHRRKILNTENARLWLECGGRIALWSWKKKPLIRKDGTEGKAMRWFARQEEIRLSMFKD